MTEPEITPPADKPQRPAGFSDEIFDAICDRMAGGEWLRKICDNDEQMPSRQTFLRWIEKDTGRQERYARASRAMVDYWAEELLELSKETEKDTIIDEKGRRKCNYEWVANKRLHADNLKFLMSKIYPKRYGDKLPELGAAAGEAEAEKKNSVAELMAAIDGKTRTINIRWHDPDKDDDATRREGARGVKPIFDDDGETIISGGDRLRARIRVLEERLGMREGKPAEPKQITYDPGPLPSRVEGEILYAVAQAIKRNVPKADQRPPEEVISEVMGEFEKLLQAKYAAQ